MHYQCSYFYTLIVIFLSYLPYVRSSIACNDNVCTPPNCFCSQQSYGNKSIKNIPQMVILLFVGNLDKLSYDMYNRLSILQNPNGCPVTLTFSIQNIRESNPCVVQQLFSSMNEFAVSSASDNCPLNKKCLKNNKDNGYQKWTRIKWSNEIGEAINFLTVKCRIPRHNIQAYCSPDLQSIRDMPWSLLYKHALKIDTSVMINHSTAKVNKSEPYRFWPHTDHFQAIYNSTNKDSSRFKASTAWIIPNNPFMINDKQFCATISECRQKVKSVSNMLMANLLSSMKSNRAPMLIVVRKVDIDRDLRLLDEIFTFMQSALSISVNDGISSDSQSVYFVDPLKVINWMQSPEDIDNLMNLASWNCELHANRQISENCQSEFDVNKDSTSELKNEKDTTENKTSKASRKRDRVSEPLFRNNIIMKAILICCIGVIVTVIYDRWIEDD